MSKEANIQLIWDFRGPDSMKTAEHHVIHLVEFLEKENLPGYVCASKSVSDLHAIAYMNVAEEHMVMIRDALIPHRGAMLG